MGHPKPPPTPHPAGACKPSGGCCDFSGTWLNHPTTTGPVQQDHNFTQSADCAVSFPWKGCGTDRQATGTVSGDTLAIPCPGFYGGKLKGTLEPATPYDLLKWSNGAAWYRAHA